MSDAQGIVQALHEMKEMLYVLIERQHVKEYYEVEEFARLTGRAPYTVREYCRNGRLRGEKKNSGRGKFLGWAISHAELVRFQREGLLPKTNNS